MTSYRLPLVSTGAPAQPADLPGADASPKAVVMAYHERTKHHFHRYAASLGCMDWATQPDPFRRYPGADLVQLLLPKPGRPLPYWQLYAPDGTQLGANWLGNSPGQEFSLPTSGQYTIRVNDFFTSLRGQPNDEIHDRVQTYMDAHPQVESEINGIRQPLTDLRSRCDLAAPPLGS